MMEILSHILVLSVVLVFWRTVVYALKLEKRVKALENKRYVELGEDIERLKVVSIGLPPGTVEMDFNGVRDIEKLSFISYVPKPKQPKENQA